MFHLFETKLPSDGENDKDEGDDNEKPIIQSVVELERRARHRRVNAILLAGECRLAVEYEIRKLKT